MTRPPTFHDRREQPPISRGSDVFLVGLGIVAVIAAVFILGAFVFGCSNLPPPCVPTRAAAIVAECRVQYRQAGCASDPEKLCPELVKACDARIDSLTDWEICTP